MPRITRMSDSKIVTYIEQGGRKENTAIKQLLDDNRGKIAAYITKNSGNSEDAKMILIEGVTEAILNIRQGKFRADSALGTYIFAICRSIWLKKLKKNKRFANVENRKDALYNDSTPLSVFNDKEIKETVNSLLSLLGNSCQKVLKLWALHYSMIEIAKELGYKSSQIAMNKKNKCLIKLKEIVRTQSLSNELLALYLSN